MCEATKCGDPKWTFPPSICYIYTIGCCRRCDLSSVKTRCWNIVEARFPYWVNDWWSSVAEFEWSRFDEVETALKLHLRRVVTLPQGVGERGICTHTQILFPMDLAVATTRTIQYTNISYITSKPYKLNYKDGARTAWRWYKKRWWPPPHKIRHAGMWKRKSEARSEGAARQENINNPTEWW